MMLVSLTLNALTAGTSRDSTRLMLFQYHFVQILSDADFMGSIIKLDFGGRIGA